MREIPIGRHLLENRAKRRLIRVRARDFQSVELPFFVYHVNGTPVGEILNAQPSEIRQRLLVFERSRQRYADVSQKLLFLLEPLSICDVLRDTEKINRVTCRVADRNFFCMQSANASIPSQYRFFRYVDFAAPVQGLAIFLDEKLSLFLGPKIVGILAFKCLVRPTEQVLTYAIQPYEPQRLTLLDEQHERNVFEDCVEECVGSLKVRLVRAQHLFGVVASSGICHQGDQMRRLSVLAG